MVELTVLLGIFLTVLIIIIIRTNHRMMKTIDLMLKQEERKLADSKKIKSLKEEIDLKQEMIEELESSIPPHVDGHN